MKLNIDKLNYLLVFMDDYINEFVDKVLADSETDPHYSAVAATNLIKCYIQIMNELGERMPYSNVKEFFKFNAYTEEEYERSEESRKKESVYYRGVQY